MATRIQHYDIGDIWTPQATFTVGGTPTDPTHLTVRQQDAAGTETVLLNNALVSGLTGSSSPVAKTSTGVFKLNPGVTLSSSGYWFVRFEGDGTAAAAEEQQAIVDPSEFTSNAGIGSRALVGLSETKDWLNQQNINTSDDLDLARVINDISDRFHDEADREFKVDGTNPQTRDFDLEPWMWYCREVPIDDLSAAATTVQIISYDLDGNAASTTTLTNLIYRPRSRKSWQPITSIQFPLSVIPPWTGYRTILRVAGNWGFPSVPGTVRQAVLDEVAAVMDRDVEHYTQDQMPQPSSEGMNVIMARGSVPPMIISLTPRALAVAQSFRQRELV